MAYNLESLLKTLQQILHSHPRIQLDSEQKLLLESLLEKVNFVKQVFENPAGGLTIHGIERRITDAARDAEDVIESHLVNHLLLSSEDVMESHQVSHLLFSSEHGIVPYYIDQLFSTPNDAEDVIQSHLRVRDQTLMIYPPDLQRVIQNFDLIKEEITKIHTTPGPGASSSSSLPVSSAMGPNPRNIVVDSDEDLLQLKHKLTNDYEKNLEVIPIVGMGGIGKTTLALNLYKDHLIVSHFDMRAWTTISQAYNEERIMSDLSKSIPGKPTDEFTLYQTLCGGRYLIVLDDLWSSQDWDSMKRLFPNNHNGSRVIVTTRNLTAANYFGSYHHQMKFLHDEESWNLLNTKVFGEETCPLELERIGHVISRDCKGLPLVVDVISGILAQLPRTQEAWEEVARDVSLAVTNTDYDNELANIMLLSYNHLPCHLKPCFLYMAAFPEDFKIRTSKLVKLWVAEGFLKPILHKSLEDVAKVYLKALVDRNLIFVCEESKTKDDVKSYTMHDVMRELCIRKASEENFLHVSMSKPQIHAEELSSLHRICEHGSTEDSVIHVKTGRMTGILCRTILLFGYRSSEWKGIWGVRLLRVLDILKIQFKKFPEEILKLINLRYLALTFRSMNKVPISVLCNLQTICFCRFWDGDLWIAKEIYEIFMVPQLRHLIFKRQYPMFHLQPGQSLTPQENLQTLSYVIVNSSLQKLLETTPNLKKLGIRSTAEEETEEINVDLTCLSKLETLKCVHEYGLIGGRFLFLIIFPPSLKKLSLDSYVIQEKHLNCIAMLPNLQVLKLVDCNLVGEMWEPPEGGFLRLKYLLLQHIINLRSWEADETHYPRLEHLTIRDCWNLDEIPIYLGDIPTLDLIELEGECKASVVESARKIQVEQLEMGNDLLKVHATNIRLTSP